MNKKLFLMHTVIMSSIVLISSCGGGGSTTEPTEEITTVSEAEVISKNSVEFIKKASGFSDIYSDIQSTSTSSESGWLRNILNLYKEQVSSNITKQEETRLCEGGGRVTIDIKQDPEKNRTIMNASFSDCIYLCDMNRYLIINGNISISGTDENRNDIIEKGSIVVKSGFSYEDQCENENIIFEKDFSLILRGYIGNYGDIEDGNENYKATITMNGGPIKIETDSKYEEGMFNNLSFYFNEYDPDNADYEWSAEGSFSYMDNFCIKNKININLRTNAFFKGYNNVECEYTGELSINNDLIVGKAYDPDGNPFTENYLKIMFNGDIIFDNICTELTIPTSCE